MQRLLNSVRPPETDSIASVSRWAWLQNWRELLAVALTLVSTAPLVAQDSQFTFDTDGNLLSQTADAPALPRILAQPHQQIVQPGELAAFSVLAADTRGLAFHWLFNGTNLPGA